MYSRYNKSTLGSLELYKTFLVKVLSAISQTFINLHTSQTHPFGLSGRLENGDVDIRGQITSVQVGDEAGIPRSR